MPLMMNRGFLRRIIADIDATITDNFLAYYHRLISLMHKLRKIVFPRGKPWEQGDERSIFG
jgi:hypothetical protein